MLKWSALFTQIFISVLLCTFSKELWLSEDNGGKMPLRGGQSPWGRTNIWVCCFDLVFDTLHLLFFSTKGTHIMQNRKAIKVEDNGYCCRYRRNISSWRCLQVEPLGMSQLLMCKLCLRPGDPDQHSTNWSPWNTSVLWNADRPDLRTRPMVKYLGGCNLMCISRTVTEISTLESWRKEVTQLYLSQYW